jgi:hypothetical protein
MRSAMLLRGLTVAAFSRGRPYPVVGECRRRVLSQQPIEVTTAASTTQEPVEGERRDLADAELIEVTTAVSLRKLAGRANSAD